jgi:hypothetical protein
VSRAPALLRRARLTRWLLPALLAAAAACGSCPPAWVGHPPQEAGWLYAEGRCGKVFVDADARRIALTRAARVVADELGLDVERRLSVTEADGKLWVEALGPEGPLHALDTLELVDEAECEGTHFVLVRLARS